MKTKIIYIVCLDTEVQNKIAWGLIDRNIDTVPEFVSLEYKGKKLMALPVTEKAYNTLLTSKKKIEREYQVALDVYVEEKDDKTGEYTLTKKQAPRSIVKKAAHRGLKTAISSWQKNQSVRAL